MGLVNLITMVFIILMVFCYVAFVQTSHVEGTMQKKGKINPLSLFFLILIGFVIRYIFARKFYGFEVDMNCFSAWSDMVFNDGIAEFYKSDAFTDYPPGYMYVLYVIGALRHLFNSLAADGGSAIFTYLASSTVLIKLPAIICDLIAGGFIYKLAKKRFSERSSLLLALFYLINPAVILNSAIWGQVDSVFTLFIILMCYYVTEKKLPIAYFVFAIGILIKPQALIFTPVLIYGILDQVILHDFKWERFFKELGLGLAAIGTMLLLAAPFGLSHVIKQYTATLGSYEYATVNGYNFWALLGKNWHSQTETALGIPFSTWGIIAIVLIVILATFISIHIKRTREEGEIVSRIRILSRTPKDKYFFIGAFIVTAVFLFSVRMHERYMFPAMVLVLISYIYKPRKETLVLYFMFTITQMNNVWHVLEYYDPSNFDWNAIFPRIIGGLTLAAFLYMIYIIIRYYVLSKSEEESVTEQDITLLNMQPVLENVQKTENMPKLNKFDFIAIAAIMVIYGAVALYDLGSHKMPQTQWETQEYYTTIDLDFGGIVHVTKLNYFLGNYENREFKLQASNDMVNWVDVSDFQMTSVFAWGSTDFDVQTQYLRLTSNSDKAVVRELVFQNSDGNQIVPVNTASYPELFDEQDLKPERSSFRDSTYFDEIYHARSAYEYMNGLYTYEWTHPPLGKIFIALGMTIFGVNPFGWRIMGTLFGIAMLPIFYLFARRLFKERWITIITTVLFAADFMHFAQTRIATIDVFVTFFIILMYYFMYRYMQMSFYDSSLKKTFLPLGCCGISMGLGIACKWPGIYAGAGLAVIFFAIMLKRYLEFRHAKKTPNGVTNGIEHQVILNKFKGNLIKTLAFCVVFFVIIPCIIYLLSYIPFRDGTDHNIFVQLIDNQKAMYNYHSNLDAEHPFSSWWYQWPIMSRPIWYYSGSVTDTVKEGISAFGNPLVWWAGIPAFLFMIYLALRKKDKIATFLGVSYLAQYLPWFLVTRCVFIYHYFPSVPFITLMVGYSMLRISNMKQKAFKKQWMIVAGCYAIAAIVLFCMFYPVLSGHPVSQSYVGDWLKWFKSWILLDLPAKYN